MSVLLLPQDLCTLHKLFHVFSVHSSISLPASSESSHTHFLQCTCALACVHTHTHTHTILKQNFHTWGNTGLLVQYYGFWKHPCFLSQLIFFTPYLIKSVPSSTSMIYPGWGMVLAHKGDWHAKRLAGFKVLTVDSWVTYACVLYFCRLGLVHSANQVGVIPFPVLSSQKGHRNCKGLWSWNWSCTPLPWDKNSLTTFSLQKGKTQFLSPGW